LVLWVCVLVGLALIVILPPSILVEPLHLIPALVAAVYVYRDAPVINRERGTDSVNATIWSLLTVFFSFIVLPVYVFVGRKGSGPRRYDVLILGIFGVLEMLGAIDLVVNPPKIQEPNGITFFSPEQFISDTAVGIFAFGLVLVVVALVVYARRRTAATRARARWLLTNTSKDTR
jgi:hypothetical protein